MPAPKPAQERWFEPYLEKIDRRKHKHYEDIANNLKKTLVYGGGISPLGLLRNCLDFALNDNAKPGGVFEAVHDAFRFTGSRKLLEDVQTINDIRNTRVAHQEKALTNRVEGKQALLRWIEALARIWEATKI
jgi:type III restriction enzyme